MTRERKITMSKMDNKSKTQHSVEEQAGFRQHRSCSDQIITLQIIIEQSIEWNSPLYINYIDFEKAFDSVNRDTLQKIIRQHDIP